jgi:hypothetical protein
MTHARQCPIGNARDHHTTVAVAYEDHIREIFVLEHADHIGDVCV